MLIMNEWSLINESLVGRSLSILSTSQRAHKMLSITTSHCSSYLRIYIRNISVNASFIRYIPYEYLLICVPTAQPSINKYLLRIYIYLATHLLHSYVGTYVISKQSVIMGNELTTLPVPNTLLFRI
ncbi:unnamed protein product [Spodoptera littoralis]|uniref:Uncharacterized protein n=1 Tax=Spodoptera littoralis TaxID=7109 RepID=A0A9P0N231_SPOLI|nr:unnamed protein product [Spodoptera littoralis]CAH1638722.1 unnamed protein product [Spodoptera littoralis]